MSPLYSFLCVINLLLMLLLYQAVFPNLIQVSAKVQCDHIFVVSICTYLGNAGHPFNRYCWFDLLPHQLGIERHRLLRILLWSKVASPPEDDLGIPDVAARRRLRHLPWCLHQGLPAVTTLDMSPLPGKISSQQLSRQCDLFSINRTCSTLILLTLIQK